MKCERVRMRLSAYMDGELDTELGREIAGHLKQCRECQEELEELSGVDLLVREMPRCFLSADFSKVVVSRVQDMASTGRSPGFLHRAWTALLEYFERFFDLLEPEVRAGTRSLDEFNDLPACFIGYAYFKAIGLQR